MVQDVSLNRIINLPSDLVVLTLAMAPNNQETEQLQNWLKVPRSADGFFLELHPKLGPVETNTLGIYLCGCAQGPKDITDSLNQASGAAAKVAALLSNEERRKNFSQDKLYEFEKKLETFAQEIN